MASRIGRITRRAFIVTAVAAAGGAGLAAWQIRRDLPNPLHPDEGAALNPWLVIGADGFTVIVPRAEMGQGVTTTLAALVAEELDADWDQIRVLHGPAAAAYYNSGMLSSALPFADYRLAVWQEDLGATAGVLLAKTLGLQATGGSSSTVDAYERMRTAGAVAREALKAEAAARLGVDAAALSTAAGMVRAADGRAIAYAELAAGAAARDVGGVTLRPRSEWRLLGRALPRVDMAAKVTGTAEFGIDVRRPGMRFATVLMPPAIAGMMGTRAGSIDPAPALAVPGVDKVLPVGAGVAVVATNTWAAFQGAEALSPDWAVPEGAPDTDALFAAITAALDDAPNSTLRDDGDVGAAPPSGAVPVSAEYRLPYLAHATMEPMNATAHLEGGHLTIWAGTQAPRLAASVAAKAAGIAAEAVTVHTTFLGGGFGRRVETDVVAQAAELAAAMPGVPVQLTWRREEDMGHDFYRPGAVARAAGWVRDGTAGAAEIAIAAQSCAQQAGARLTGLPMGGTDKALVEGAFDQPYAIPNYRVRGHVADLPVPVGFWRSVGASINGFVHESFIDELAHVAGRDPLDFRLDLVRPEHEPSARLLETVAEMSGWHGPRAPGTALGVALTWSFGTPVAQVVEVEDRDGAIAIPRAWIACDPGIALDPGIIAAQMTSGLIFGLSAAVGGEITFADGGAEQQNFPDYDALRMPNAPAVEVRILEHNPRMGGIGEPGTPPAAPALANAIFALTGMRVRELPLAKHIRFA